MFFQKYKLNSAIYIQMCFVVEKESPKQTIITLGKALVFQSYLAFTFYLLKEADQRSTHPMFRCLDS